jgi:hypothetical protein
MHPDDRGSCPSNPPFFVLKASSESALLNGGNPEVDTEAVEMK